MSLIPLDLLFANQINSLAEAYTWKEVSLD